MKTYRKNRSREKSISSTISYKLLSFLTTDRLIQSTITTLLLLPALFSCELADTLPDNKVIETKVMISDHADVDRCGPLDIFTFDSDGTGLLDSYEHVEAITENRIGIRSQTGDKHIFICMNGQRTRYDWSDINSLQAIANVHIELKNERREALCSTGTCDITAGSPFPYGVDMRNIACEIVLNSIRCDFEGKAYEGCKITDVTAYLTNVNSRCSISADGNILPLSIVNAGRYDPEDLSDFAEPDLVFRKVTQDIGDRRIDLGLSFICYPNASPEEGPGTPFTRLVIEGSIEGEKFWWPIDINREEGSENPGIHRNRRYIFDIVIKRKGSSDPDITVDTETAEIQKNIRPWKEKEEQHVIF